jgi:hypothetical protein
MFRSQIMLDKFFFLVFFIGSIGFDIIPTRNNRIYSAIGDGDIGPWTPKNNKDLSLFF